MMYIVDGQVDLDPDGQEHLSMPLGPFESVEAAEKYMLAQGPLWGTWTIRAVWSAEPAVE